MINIVTLKKTGCSLSIFCGLVLQLAVDLLSTLNIGCRCSILQAVVGMLL